MQFHKASSTIAVAAAAKLNHMTCIQQQLLIKCSCAWICHGRMKQQIMNWMQTPRSQQAPASSELLLGVLSTNPYWQANHSPGKPTSSHLSASIGRVAAMCKFHSPPPNSMWRGGGCNLTFDSQTLLSLKHQCRKYLRKHSALSNSGCF